MHDPREDKLPKWAQELLYENRKRAALRYPEQPAPAPYFLIDGSGRGVDTPSLRAAYGQAVYSISGALGGPYRVRKEYADEAGFLHRTLADAESKAYRGGSRGHGEYWLSRADAYLAARWRAADAAAYQLMTLAREAEQADD